MKAHALLAALGTTFILAACAAPADEATTSTSAVETTPEEKPLIIGGAIGEPQTALSKLDVVHVGVRLDVPGLYMCGAKILLAADAPAGLESTLVRHGDPDFFSVDFTVERVSPREIRLVTGTDPSGWSGVLHLTTSDGRTIAETFAGIDGTIEQLYCREVER